MVFGGFEPCFFFFHFWVKITLKQKKNVYDENRQRTFAIRFIFLEFFLCYAVLFSICSKCCSHNKIHNKNSHSKWYGMGSDSYAMHSSRSLHPSVLVSVSWSIRCWSSFEFHLKQQPNHHFFYISILFSICLCCISGNFSHFSALYICIENRSSVRASLAQSEI